MVDNSQSQTEETQPTEETTPEQEEKAPETQEQPPEEAEAKEGEPEAAKDAEEADGEEQPSAEEKSRRAGGWKRKLERQERELELLRAQVAQRAAQQPQAEAKPKDPAAQVEEYVATLVEQRLQAERAKESQAKAQAEFQRRMTEVRATHKDFDDVIEDVAHIPVPSHVQQLLTGPQGPDLMYMLAKNPAELARISALPPFEAAREIGRLEAKASSTPAPKAPTKSATRPPVPPTSVGGSSSARNLDDLPLSEYKRAYRSGRR